MENKHEFHLIMDSGMKQKLKDLDVFRGVTSLSGIVVRIVEVLAPVIGREHKWGKQRMSRYRAVCNDPEEVREHVHVYLAGRMYRNLKLLHQDLNFYSIAQLLRGLVDFFLGLVDVYGGCVLEELEGLFAQWREEAGQMRQTPRKLLRQLRKIIRHLPGKNRLVTLYDNHFAPFWILRI